MLRFGEGRKRRSQKPKGLLSPREREILLKVAEGNPDKTTAVELGMSKWTVRNHMSRIREKLGAQGRTSAVIVGLKLGEISLAEISVPKKRRPRLSRIGALIPRVSLTIDWGKE